MELRKKKALPEAEEMEDREREEYGAEWMDVATLFPYVASYLRRELSNVYLASRQLAAPEKREHSPETDERAAFLDQSYYRVLRILNNLSNTAYFSTETPMRREICDIVEPFATLCDEAGDLAGLKGISLKFRCPVERHVSYVCLDALKKLLYHLLSNAIKFTDPGGSITVDLRTGDGQIILSVSDTGRGISEELMPTLFDRVFHYTRMDPPPHGIGLGIPLCRKIAMDHGGVLLAQSKPGKGTTFTLSIPDQAAPRAVVREHAAPLLSGFNETLVALSDAMPVDAFLYRNEY